MPISDIDSQISENNAAKKRPIIITIICIIGFISAAIEFYGALEALYLSISWHLLKSIVYGMSLMYFLLSSIMSVVSLIGLWRMKKWSVIMYAVLFVPKFLSGPDSMFIDIGFLYRHPRFNICVCYYTCYCYLYWV